MSLSFDRLRGPLIALLSLAAGAALWQYLGTTIPKTEFVGFTATISYLDLIYGLKGHTAVVLRLDAEKTFRTPGRDGLTLPSIWSCCCQFP